MWPLPFIFYSKDGWKAIGIKKVEKPLWFIWGILLGIGAAFFIYFIGWSIFGNTIEHWYISILNQVISEDDRVGMSKAILFPIVTGPAILFSPIGEEFLFRGMIHEGFKKSTHIWRAGFVNSLAFAFIHIFHYGIAYNSSTGLKFHPWTGLLWFLFMAGVSGIFTLCREKSKSIFPAIVSHSAFNLTMNATIFLFLI
jgi:membrane protease YdiL (CAAX protease family)